MYVQYAQKFIIIQEKKMLPRLEPGILSFLCKPATISQFNPSVTSRSFFGSLQANNDCHLSSCINSKEMQIQRLTKRSSDFILDIEIAYYSARKETRDSSSKSRPRSNVHASRSKVRGFKPN